MANNHTNSSPLKTPARSSHPLADLKIVPAGFFFAFHAGERFCRVFFTVCGKKVGQLSAYLTFAIDCAGISRCDAGFFKARCADVSLAAEAKMCQLAKVRSLKVNFYQETSLLSAVSKMFCKWINPPQGLTVRGANKRGGRVSSPPNLSPASPFVFNSVC